MEKIINKYFKRVCDAYKLGNTETAYNAPIMDLLKEFDCTVVDLSGGRGGNLGENIDLKLWHSEEETSEISPFAAVEVKKINGIDERAKKNIIIETKSYGNVILTDNLRWEFWHLDENNEPERYTGVQLIEFDGGKLKLKKENISLFVSLVKDFMLLSPTNIQSSKKLAEYMAIHARTIREVIFGVLKEDEQKLPLVNERQLKLPMFVELYGLFKKIRAELSSEIKTADFADMYAQTIVYGLFIARYNDPTPDNFNRSEALVLLQKESALLKLFFIHITTAQNEHPTLIAVIDKLCDLYKICDLSGLLDKEESRDTIVHFYEDFLSAYDPQLRKSLGVFYTPQPIVHYMISKVDEILVEEFNIQGGLSNNETFDYEVKSEEYSSSNRKNAVIKNTKIINVPKVAILDPATGTGTFPAEIIKFVKEKYFSGGKSTFYESWINKKDGLMSRLVAFEIMMTSYVVAHLKIRRSIDETLGHSNPEKITSNIFLTNTLAPAHTDKERVQELNLFMDFSGAISDEAYHADTWKNRRPIKVVIGNPPYLAANKQPFDTSKYRVEVDGTRFNERNSKILDDLYVKFFRFSEELIQTNNEGILAFITNNNYLDAVICRGMRSSLLKTFDKIYIINLHGSTVKKEISPDGTKDENVFDIMQGVAIFIGVKTSENKDWGELFYSDLFGSRNKKFDELLDNNINFMKVIPDKKNAYFIPIEDSKKEQYESGISLAELFISYTAGTSSGNDSVAIAPTKIELEKRLSFVRNTSNDEQLIDFWKKFASGQTVKSIQDDVLYGNGVISKIDYRPFDTRWIYYTGNSNGWVSRPRDKKIMGNLLSNNPTPIGKNIALIFTRMDPTIHKYSTIFLSQNLFDKDCVPKSYVAPLYIYDELLSEWVPNLDNSILNKLTASLDYQPEPIEILDYCYGILNDPKYRENYNEFLKRDYPKVPLIKDLSTLQYYQEAGKKLRMLHLMERKVQFDIEIETDESSNMIIESVKYKNSILSINKSTKLIGVSEEIWNFRMGGHQIVEKWLKSHKGDVIDLDTFELLSNICGLVKETIVIQKQLNGFYELK